MSRKHAPRGPIKAREGSAPIEPQTHQGQKCTARSSRTGAPCQKWAIAGATVCRSHGGAAPQVQEKAKERLRALFPKSVRVLDELLDASDFPTVRYQTAKFIAEQEVGRAKETTEVTVKSAAEMTDEELRARALALAQELRG